MSKPTISNSEHCYNFLLRLYPMNYRHEFEEEMRFVFSEMVRDEYQKKGYYGMLDLWLKVTIDTTRTLVTQHLDNQIKKADMKINTSQSLLQKNLVVRPSLAAIAFLFVAVIGNEFVSGWNWGVMDFVITTTMIFSTGVALEFVGKKFAPSIQKAIAAAIIVAIFIWIWAELAVGIFTNWGS